MTDDTMTIRPKPRDTMPGTTARVASKAVERLRSNDACQVSGSVAASEPDSDPVMT